MINIFFVSTSLLFVLSSFNGFAQQKKVTILGSSTAYGTGATVPDSSWVGRLGAYFNRNSIDGIDTTVNNRAVGGYDTYKSLPTGYPHPVDRPDPDPTANITYVLNDLPRADAVVVNYPTNDIVYGYTAKEMMDNLRLMYQQFTQNGIRCFITTSQPRNTASESQRAILRQLVDSIQLNFGIYAINFWDDLATPDNLIKPEVNSGDGIHVNNLGHRLLFQRVQARNILSVVVGAPLPLAIKRWQAILENRAVKLSWNTTYEEPDTYFEIQRSKDGQNFQTLYQIINSHGDGNYSWTDLSPSPGKNYYRLKIIEPNKISYSKIILINNDLKQLIESLYTDASQLHLQLNNNRGRSAVFDIINHSGSLIKQQSLKLNGTNNSIKISILDLPAGNYFIRITTPDGFSEVKQFTRLK
jgi:lysophospholipase L1-like esterase